MKINEIIREVLENTTTEYQKKYTQTMLAEKMSEKSGKAVSLALVNDRLKTENMRVNTAIEMLDVLGYEMVVCPKSDKDPRKVYVVECGENNRLKGDK